MTVEEKTDALLIAAAAVTALVPATRIAVRGERQNITAPYIVHQSVDTDAKYVLEGKADRAREIYQTDVFAVSYSSGLAISKAITAALTGVHSGFTYFHRGRPYQYETDTRLHHFTDSWEVFG